MKSILSFFVLVSLYGNAQEMNVDKLQTIYSTISDSINSRNSSWQFYIKEIPILSIADTNHNRMRIMSPIMDSNNLTNELMQASLVANFHTALDVKYAVSEGILWTVFIHPLKELTEDQVIDAIKQVYSANINFGTSFSSTPLSFPSRLNVLEKEEDIQIIDKPKVNKI